MSDKSSKIASIVNDLRRVFQVLSEKSKHAELRTGLTGPQLWALKEIVSAGSLNGVELARRMIVHPATIVSIIDHLERRALVARIRSTKDRRVVNIEPTETGSALAASVPDAVQNTLVSGLTKLQDEELDPIITGLHHLVVVLGVEKVPPLMIMSTEYAARRRSRRVSP